MTDPILFHPTSQVVFDAANPPKLPNPWLSTGMDNNLVFLAWSYKQWGTKIVQALVVPQAA